MNEFMLKLLRINQDIMKLRNQKNISYRDFNKALMFENRSTEQKIQDINTTKECLWRILNKQS